MTLLLTLAALWPVGPAGPAGAPPPEILRGWQPPAGPYGPGHRGVDLAAPPGAPVRAPVAGTVSFAGPVGGRGVLTLTLPGTGAPPLRTTFSPVTPLVRAGTRVAAGTPVALVAPGTHCPETCLHWGLLRGGTYLNPLVLVRRAPSRLLPVGDGSGGAVPIRPGSR
ncbi:murein hydrolase activator EnvC family protein [Streptomyces sp. NPDC015130]|uniref:murein hydrolase activator EnvC family protein n=1 Tax=Streptomyces sp. NPDC015130 TaxID=3364940 RepID=UPI003701AC22